MHNMQQRQIEDSPYSLQSAMGSAATAAARRGFADSESFASNLPPVEHDFAKVSSKVMHV